MDLKIIDFGFSQKIIKQKVKSTQFYGSGVYSVP